MNSLRRTWRWPFGTLFRLLVVVVAATACNTDTLAGEETFTEYTHDSGRFTIMLPGSDTPTGGREGPARTMGVVRKGVFFAEPRSPSTS